MNDVAQLRRNLRMASHSDSDVAASRAKTLLSDYSYSYYTFGSVRSTPYNLAFCMYTVLPVYLKFRQYWSQQPAQLPIDKNDYSEWKTS